jgi:hypothetical protein
VQLIKTVDLHANKNYLMCAHPHGVFGHGLVANFCTEATGFSRKFPGITPSQITSLLYLPVLREMAMLFGFCNSSDRSLKFILDNTGKCKDKGQV